MDAFAVEEVAARIEREAVPVGESRERPCLGDLPENWRPGEVVGDEDEMLCVDMQFSRGMGEPAPVSGS